MRLLDSYKSFKYYRQGSGNEILGTVVEKFIRCIDICGMDYFAGYRNLALTTNGQLGVFMLYVTDPYANYKHNLKNIIDVEEIHIF